MTDSHQADSRARPDRVALVTGAARGIGAAISRRLVADGLSVALLDVRPTVQELALDLERGGARVTSVQADVTCELDLSAAMTHVHDSLGPVAVLVNNAALTAVHRDWTSVTPEQWRQVMDVNLMGAFLSVRAVHEDMALAGWGRIVNVSSVTFSTGQRRLVDYVSSKGGLVGLTRTLARELGEEGITVNAVSPGSIRTEADLELFPDQEEVEREARAVQAIPRRGVPEDIAAAVSFLSSDDASFISGQVLNVDGGWVMH